jgi:hypothetical protein
MSRGIRAALVAAVAVGWVSVAESAGPTVEQVLARNADARGGLAAWKRIESMQQIGTIVHHANLPGSHADSANAANAANGAASPNAAKPELQAPFMLELKRPNKLHLEIQYQGAKAIQVFDGTRGYLAQPSARGPVVQVMSPATIQSLSQQMDIEGPLMGAAAHGASVRLEGLEQVEGRSTYKLTIQLPGGGERHVWLDAVTFLDLKIDGTRLFNGRALPTETWFSDYRKVDDVYIPFAIDTSINGVHSMEGMVLSRILLNVPLEDAEFELPGGLPRPGGAAKEPAH